MGVARQQPRELDVAAGYGDDEDGAAEKVERGLEEQRDVEDAGPVPVEVVCGDRFVPVYVIRLVFSPATGEKGKGRGGGTFLAGRADAQSC